MLWTDVLVGAGENRRAQLAVEILAGAAYGSTAARVRAFVAQGGATAERPASTIVASSAAGQV